jgi:hypothetical protein
MLHAETTAREHEHQYQPRAFDEPASAVDVWPRSARSLDLNELMMLYRLEGAFTLDARME